LLQQRTKKAQLEETVASVENKEYREKREQRTKREKNSVTNELGEKCKILIFGGPKYNF
jgi:hypothetical protein